MTPMRSLRLIFLTAVVAPFLFAACRSTAPAGSEPSTTPEQVNEAGAVKSDPGADDGEYSEADVRFMQGMIIHHAQAVRMSGLVPERSDYEPLRILSQRIDISQRDEIALMQRWLDSRGEQAPQPDLTYPLQDPVPLMAGMLTMDEMEQLEAASGRTFAELFLKGMIQHHRGALIMVENLLGQPGAAQSPLIFEYANEIAGVQRSQISRMRTLLVELEEMETNDGE